MQDRIEILLERTGLEFLALITVARTLHSWVFLNCSKRGIVSEKDIFA